jgi:anti-sigma regulatory factor (Ser/Thr protein kinase)
MPAHWPLPADHSAAGVARRAVSDELAHRPNVNEIALVASELTTNAVAHGLPPVHLHLEFVRDHIRVTVSNTSGRGVPAQQHAAEHDNSGRGLAIVSQLAEDWGWSEDGGRLRVWADFSADD